MQLASSTLLLVLSISIATLQGVSPTAAAVFTSGSHVVNSTIDGIVASGPDTVITVEESAIVEAIPADSGRPFSMRAEDGAQIIINGGTFLHEAYANDGANLEINGGTFEKVGISSNSSALISNGLFQKNVLAFGSGQLDIHGGNFRTVGFDSSLGAEINIFVDSVNFSELNGTEIPYDALGTTITLTDLSIFEDDGGIDGEYADLSPYGFGLFFDGAGGAINIKLVPEPATLGQLTFVGVFLALKRQRNE